MQFAEVQDGKYICQVQHPVDGLVETLSSAHLGASLTSFPPLTALHQELLPLAQLSELSVSVQPDLIPAHLCISADKTGHIKAWPITQLLQLQPRSYENASLSIAGQ